MFGSRALSRDETIELLGMTAGSRLPEVANKTNAELCALLASQTRLILEEMQRLLAQYCGEPGGPNATALRTLAALLGAAAVARPDELPQETCERLQAVIEGQRSQLPAEGWWSWLRGKLASAWNAISSFVTGSGGSTLLKLATLAGILYLGNNAIAAHEAVNVARAKAQEAAAHAQAQQARGQLGYLSQFGDVLQGTAQGIGEGIRDVGEGLGSAYRGLGQGARDIVTGLGSAVSDAASGLGRGIATSALGVGAGVVGIGVGAHQLFSAPGAKKAAVAAATLYGGPAAAAVANAAIQSPPEPSKSRTRRRSRRRHRHPSTSTSTGRSKHRRHRHRHTNHRPTSASARRSASRSRRSASRHRTRRSASRLRRSASRLRRYASRDHPRRSASRLRRSASGR